VIARAKINLTLHVGAVNRDGYHLLQSLVVFADIGDEVSMEMSETAHGPRLTISGPFAGGLGRSEDNLILRAAALVRFEGKGAPVFHLVKNLPIASGLGGGSADAAAAVRLLCAHTGQNPQDYLGKLVKLGADIPVCLGSSTCRMGGIGEHIIPMPGLGQIHAVLVNPGLSLSTAKVFKAFEERPDTVPQKNGSLLIMALAGRNDLQAPAIGLAPMIGDVLALLGAQPDCQLARMSGSGATCFGLFPTAKTARNAAAQIKSVHPDWWSVATVLGDTL